MPSIAVKICGITSAEAVEAAVAAGAAYGGLNFHPASPRYISLDQARALSSVMAGRLKRVAVIADLKDAQIEAVIAAASPEFLQLHGGESVARAAEIRTRFGLPVIRALPVGEAADLDAAQDYAPVVDMFLFDAKPPKGADRAGGHGAAFDWSLLKDRTFGKPWFLAGGLNPGNVGRAAVLSQAALVDVSSGVESAPGVKDSALISNFIHAAKSA